uniref:Uncharacterized protein n=1 Tax=Arundo donax TaxID=35708 RepID=A0A0A9DK18_ARUDO
MDLHSTPCAWIQLGVRGVMSRGGLKTLFLMVGWV